MRIAITEFALRNWEPGASGTRMLGISPDDLVRRGNQALADGTALVPGYAPFCKHLFLPNDTPTLCGFAPVTEGNRHLLRSGYRARRDGERAVLYFHESVGSSRLLPGTERLANEHNLRIVVPDRPGFGFSDAQPNLTLSAVAEEMLYLLDHLSIDRATYCGLFTGAAYALATACLQPERVHGIWCVSGRLSSTQDDASLTPLVKVRTQLARQPWVLNSFFNILRSRSSDQLHRRLVKRIYGAVPEDARVLEQYPLILEHLIGTTQESMAQSSSGIVEEIRLFAATPALSMQTLTMPITLWHGRADPIAPAIAMKDAMAGVSHEYREFANSGALLVFEHWQELLAAMGAAERQNLP